MAANTERLVLNADELAAALGICRPAAYDLMHRRDFPSIQVTPRRFVVPKAALEEWLLQQAQGGKEAE